MDTERTGPNALFQGVVASRIEATLAEANEFGLMQHAPRKGEAKEQGFGRLLGQFLPQAFDVGSGVIHDCNGTESAETDLVVWDRSSLPPVFYAESTGVFPVESCYYAIEVKSRSTRTEIRDAYEKAQKLRRLRFLANYDGNVKGLPVPVYFAYGTDLSGKTELDRYREIDGNYLSDPAIRAICVVGDGYYTHVAQFKDRETGAIAPKWLKFHADEGRYEVMALLSGIVNTVLGRSMPNLGYYLLHGEGHPAASVLE